MFEFSMKMLLPRKEAKTFKSGTAAEKVNENCMLDRLHGRVHKWQLRKNRNTQKQQEQIFFGKSVKIYFYDFKQQP